MVHLGFGLAFPPVWHHYSDRSRHCPSPLATPDRHAKGRVSGPSTSQSLSWRPQCLARQGVATGSTQTRPEGSPRTDVSSADADVCSPVADVGSRGDCIEGRLTRPLGGSVPLSWRHSSNVWALLRIDGWHGFFQRQPRIARVSGVSCRMGETGFAVRACASASGRMVSYRNWCSPKPLGSDGGLLKT